MSAGGQIDYTRRYQIQSARTVFADFIVNSIRAQEKKLVIPNVYPPDKDASIVTLLNEGRVNTTVEEYNRYLDLNSNTTIDLNSNTSIDVIIPSAPPAEPPTDIQIISGNTEVLVFFTPNSQASNYQYSINNGVTYTSFSPAETIGPVKITGLTNNLEYKISLKSLVNGVGGTGSSPISIKPGVPNAPTNLIATTGNGQLTISFTVIGSGGSNITNYEYSLNGGLTFSAFNPPQIAVPVTITGLTNGTSYAIRLKAVNVNGSSYTSESVVGTPFTTPILTLEPALYIGGDYRPPNFIYPVTFRSFNPGGSWATQLPYTFNNPSNASDMYTLKQDMNGVNQWAARISGGFTSTNTNSKNCISDNDGNIYVFGRYNTTTNIYNSGLQNTEIFNLNSLNGYSMFIIKYNTQGLFQWAIQIHGSTIDIPIQLSLDSNRNLYVSFGLNSSSVTVVNTNRSTFTIQKKGGNTDSCVIKFNSSGLAQWNISLSGTKNEIINSLKSDQEGNIYIGGDFDSPTLLLYDTNGSEQSLTLSGQTSGFIARYTSTGIFSWATTITCSNSCSVADLSIDSNNNIYICGTYKSTLTINNFGGGSLSYTLPYTGLSDLPNSFLIKYNTIGIANWGVRFNHTSTYSMIAVINDNNNNCYVTGYFDCDNSSSIPIYNAGNGISALPYTFPNNLSNRSITGLVKYNTSGQAQWGSYILPNNFVITPKILQVDNNNNIYQKSVFLGIANSVSIFYPKGIQSFWYTINASFTETSTTLITKYDQNGIIQWANKNTGSM